jgi:hypothetical protein
LVVGALAAAFATSFLVWSAHFDTTVSAANGSVCRPHAGAGRRGLCGLLAHGDGQAYAGIARDPAVGHPDGLETIPEAAYRDQRPLFGELAWAVSLGDPQRVPSALAILSVVSAALAATALAVALGERGVNPFFALGIFALPAGSDVISGMTPELLEIAFVTFAILAWERKPRRTGWAIAALCLAALTRESMLLVPLGFAVLEARRIREFDRSARVALGALALPFACYGAWIGYVKHRLGYWPWEHRTQRLTAIPFGGLVDQLRHSGDWASTAALVVFGAALVGYTLIRGRHGGFYTTVVALALLAPFLGPAVWRHSADFGRVLLPVYAFSAVLVLAELHARRSRYSAA